jgi:DNA repair protein RadC
MEINDLQKTFKGLGLAKSVTILAALELGNRMLREESEAKENIISNSKDLFDYASESLIDLNHEEFWAIFLNQRNKVTHSQRISMGGLTQTTVDLRVIFKAALENKATALAVAHNHPSGNLKPSTPDKELTRRIAEAGNILNIKLIDHIIVGILPDGKRDYFSFSEHGLL